jgi:two-component system phosphate regulon sensor histidine kinase PhoR
MKSRQIKIFTIIGLLALIALQSIWLYNTYIQFSISIYRDSNDILKKSLNREASLRFAQTSKGTIISGATTPAKKNDVIVPEIAYMNEALQKLGFELSLTDVDSIADNFLKATDVESTIVICLINPKTEEILNKSKNDLDIHSLGIIKTDIIPIRTDLSQGVQMILINPYYTIIKRMGLLLIATVILMIFIIGCIIYQIKIIAKQNKIAQIREDFSYAMVHDMKMPLGSIMMCNNFLHSGKLDNKPEMKNRYFTIIDSEIDHLLTLANKVLTISKLENHKLEMDKSKILLAPIIKDLIEKFTAKATKPIHFSIDLQVNDVYADEEFFKEVISNLIDNAIKYSKESIEIKISSHCDDKYTIIKIYDNGIGISEKDQRTIFDKFERASATKRTKFGGATGFGLGLNYVYQVMEAHEGKIIVNSIEREFTEFTLFIPKIMKEL